MSSVFWRECRRKKMENISLVNQEGYSLLLGGLLLFSHSSVSIGWALRHLSGGYLNAGSLIRAWTLQKATWGEWPSHCILKADLFYTALYLYTACFPFTLTPLPHTTFILGGKILYLKGHLEWSTGKKAQTQLICVVISYSQRTHIFLSSLRFFSRAW